ncbi:DUF934 domain-containing protein [Methylovirgula sp. 4M-Z18]|uniref:DUF934 domain-containing protein n=1 Tax=Methylovirgula sp. 4M-Z18 TaxID=2293567 RepID=UPI000E2E8F05|nr:DUF934 domain-containing protein [Methylovirgula sp. 4M-Z18]RFB80588.1 DUF934 domain-containing protein [Methylovirgula sp. 4M-Z18]
MTIVREGRFCKDTYKRIDADWELPVNSDGLGDAIVPFDWLEDLEANWPNRGHIGVDVKNTMPFEELEPHLDRLTLIAINFPAFSDGRGFSLAKTLRNHGFKGTLRATGPLIADQYFHTLGCGFDEVEIPEAMAARQPEDQWRQAHDLRLLAYQRGYGGDAKNILEQRRAGRR